MDHKPKTASTVYNHPSLIFKMGGRISSSSFFPSRSRSFFVLFFSPPFPPIFLFPLFVLPLFIPPALLTSLYLHFLSIFVLFLSVFVPPLPAPSHPEWTRVEASPSSSPQAPPHSDSMTQSTAMRAERGGGNDWGSFRTVSLSTWANRVSGKQGEWGGRETGREAINQLVREGWQSDSQCTITLVFRFGPSERSFWTQRCLNVSSRSFFLLSFLELPPMEIHSCHASLLLPV